MLNKDLLMIGDVVWCKLRGDERSHIQNGVRPCVIIQNNKGNHFSPTIQVVPLTSRKNKTKLPTHVQIPAQTAGLSKDSIAQCEGARPVSKSDILGFIGTMPESYMHDIGIALMINIPIIQYMSLESLTTVYNNLAVN